MEECETTPLGFLNINVEKGSHIMHAYTRKDEKFLNKVTRFVLAGVEAGELVGCAMDSATRTELERRLTSKGITTDPEHPKTQVFLSDAASVFLQDGLFCPTNTSRYCRRLLAIAKDRSVGLRIISDSSDLSVSKVTRLKLLEYEALWQNDLSFTIAMSIYETAPGLRSFISEVKRLHPLVTTNNGVKRNPSYVDPQRFLAGFYRYQRVMKEYPAVSESEAEVIHDFEEIAARTPLSAVEISRYRTAIELLLAYSTGGQTYHGIPVPTLGEHFHVSFNTESDKMMVAFRYHAPGVQRGPTNYQEFVQTGRMMTEKLIDDLRIEVWPDLVIITMMKTYTNPLKIKHDIPDKSKG